MIQVTVNGAAHRFDDALDVAALLERLEIAGRKIAVERVDTASDAAIAMELGCDSMLMNAAIAAARDPVLMAGAMKKGVQAGREAFLAGRMPKKLYSATPSSPMTGTISGAAQVKAA